MIESYSIDLEPLYGKDPPCQVVAVQDSNETVNRCHLETENNTTTIPLADNNVITVEDGNSDTIWKSKTVHWYNVRLAALKRQFDTRLVIHQREIDKLRYMVKLFLQAGLSKKTDESSTKANNSKVNNSKCKKHQKTQDSKLIQEENKYNDIYYDQADTVISPTSSDNPFPDLKSQVPLLPVICTINEYDQNFTPIETELWQSKLKSYCESVLNK